MRTESLMHCAICGDVMTIAGRELAAFFVAVTELFGSEQAEASVEDWLSEMMASDGLPVTTREWRLITVAAAARLASGQNALIFQSRLAFFEE